MNKIILVLIAVLSIGNTIFAQNNAGFQNISEMEMEKMINLKDVKVIDVRTKAEVESGYIDGTDYFIDYNSAEFESKINLLDKSASYIIYCRSGARSSGAAGLLAKKDFKVYNLSGGIIQLKNRNRIVK